ncbi:hypothetical protein [Salipiger mucosus]|uniref:Uncharacterized protein n=1 Tax=Salipiger mucosus DSM 16094 TaxID=1123237 RepID=S9SBD1_9RHOB|nr:hypothetical protein [Salipiger mucosus]EPX83529.1 hypothetical protein Salmuc_02137 [Salipiger mucosus DSM 16094]
MARDETSSGVKAYSKEEMLSGAEIWKNYSAALSQRTGGALSGLLKDNSFDNV